MRQYLKYIFQISFLILFISASAQIQTPIKQKITISGKIVEKNSKQPLEYATLAFINAKNPTELNGGITNEKGEFSIDILPGTYTIKIEFISFKILEIKPQLYKENKSLGVIALEEDVSLLKEVVVKSEKSAVEIKLDKKIYNVAKDMTVKGGTASDVLNNVPSVAVDADGTVSLRGNESVRILIDGRPANVTNINDALRSISSDALEKVEVITNPSARYDAEGGGGIINIVLKKGKNNGLNGSFVATVGDPKNLDFNSNINYKTNKINLFTTLGYNDSNAPGNSHTYTDYLNADNSVLKTINEDNIRSRKRKNYSANIGMDYFLTPTITWTNAIKYRHQNGDEPSDVNYFNYSKTDFFVRNRYNDQQATDEDFQYTSNLTKNFKKEGHKLTFDFSQSVSKDSDNSIITDQIIDKANTKTQDYTAIAKKDASQLIQTDYVLPLGKESQLEAGYKGQFRTLTSDYNIGAINNLGNYIMNTNYSNALEYKETINAIYTQFGSKYKKLSYLLGLRYENSIIDINLLTTSNFNTKKYDNIFPSAFFTYSVSEQGSFSLNYSKRISRPESRQLNPFSNYASNVNIFQGNPDLNPSYTNVFELSYLNKFGKTTFTSSIYYNNSTEVFRFIRRPNGDTVTATVDGVTVVTPVIVSTPINLAKDNRYGFEFNLNYSLAKWWKINQSLNAFKSMSRGDYAYTDINNKKVIQNFDVDAYSWFTRLTSKINLPLKIDWQTNAMYFGPAKSAQGRTLEMYTINFAFSKDVLKDKATISLNVSDLLNSGKRRFETAIAGVINSYNEMQFRQRQINLSFTYRFNKKKAENEKGNRQQNGENGEEF